MANLTNLNFDNKFAALPEYFYTKMPAEAFAEKPWLVHANPKAAELIDLNVSAFKNKDFPLYFSGNKQLSGGETLTMVYAGHQFGTYVPQLGDGRALLLGQVRNSKGESWDIHLKGSGKTPYSRFGDGRAVLRSCIREYLCSEAMFALGIETTRALCIIATGDPVQRETMEPGAILTRLSPSHVRFGHFEYFHYNNQIEAVKLLADHVIDEHFPKIKKSKNRYADWFSEIVKRTARLMAQWQAVGFSHGVMNTDNMSILGITMDYGPFGFMEAFDPNFICNHSDPYGRYAYDKQPTIGLWNLHAFSHSLQSLLPLEESATILGQYEKFLSEHYHELMRAKLGFKKEENGDYDLWLDLMKLMALQRADYTLVFRNLIYLEKDQDRWLSLFNNRENAKEWLGKYLGRIKSEKQPFSEIANELKTTNPKYILRNWVAEVAIRAAEDNKDYTEIGNILKLMHNPYDEHPKFSSFAGPAPEKYHDLCVSCSS